MRLLLLSLAALAISAGMASAQIILVPDAQDEGTAEDDMNVIPQEKLSWEEAVGHPDITVVKPGPDGLEVMTHESIEQADQSKLLQQRKSVVRLEDRVDPIEIEEIPLEPESPEARILKTEGFSEQDQNLPEED